LRIKWNWFSQCCLGNSTPISHSESLRCKLCSLCSCTKIACCVDRGIDPWKHCRL
jgi:hypothetical protein